MQDFQKLKVWEKSHHLAIDIHRVAGTFSRSGTALTSQLRRAALSVPSNIAEGSGKLGQLEFRRYLQIAMGSAAEVKYHLLAARDLELIGPETYHDLSERTSEVRRMLTGLIKRLTPSDSTLGGPIEDSRPPAN
ncbi:MAG: four helix bundle protein [bacterium]